MSPGTDRFNTNFCQLANQHTKRYNTLMKKIKKSAKATTVTIILTAITVLSLSACTNQPENVSSQNILVSSPRPQELVSSPLTIQGRARVFEQQFNYKIESNTGEILAAGTITAAAQDPSEFGNFETQVLYNQPSTKEGTVELFDYSAKDGSEIDKISIPVEFKDTITAPQETTTVKLFFSKFSPDNQTDCTTVFPVERTVEKTEGIARLAINLLLQGPTQTEKSQGYSTNINEGVTIKSINIDDEGTLTLDLDKQINYQLGGSCRVTAIRSQLTKTLEQFPTVKNVIISVEGQTEDILQP